MKTENTTFILRFLMLGVQVAEVQEEAIRMQRQSKYSSIKNCPHKEWTLSSNLY
jgi:hypothetical protein